ncbi:hypothetical protein FACS1894171_2660 [Clostridia bacterium]|nr:hypothetical protein FACS1894171_2660 [Clostridia bacterium]
MRLTGAIAAAIGLCLPSLIILTAISMSYSSFRNNEYISAMLSGVRACVVALILSAVFNLKSSAIKNPFGWIIAAASFAAMLVFNINPVVVILASGLLGWLYCRLKPA